MALNIGNAFSGFCSALNFSDEDIESIRYRYHRITKRINIDYWKTNSDSAHSLYVGSYGRDTEIHTSDIDMLVQLPFETYKKYDAYSSNGQSALLQEVKHVIEKTYAVTALKSDGQIISIPFTDGISFEVLPAFINHDGSYTFANTNNGGSWKITDPKAEINAIRDRNNTCNGNLKRLCRMTRAWRDTNYVDISGILIDVLAYSFIETWEYKDKSYVYYDWMTRDFLKYISEVPKTQYKWKAMGSGRYITYFGEFQDKAKEAYDKAVEAISKESDAPITANLKWREIYGSKFPYQQ